MADETDGFITLPPGLLDSGTVKRPSPRATRAPRPTEDDVIFFPAGAAPAGVDAPEAVVPAPAPAADVPPPPVAPATVETPVAEETLLAGTVASRLASPPALDPDAPWRLALPDGREVPIAGVVLLGRDPEHTAAWPDAALVPLDDPGKSVSKTHAAVELDAGGVWVHDLDSTNGVWVVDAADQATEVVPGRRAAVPAGGTVEIGDLVLRVLR